MKLYSEFIQQMDVVLELLNRRSQLEARLAFNILDNLAELTARRSARDLVRTPIYKPKGKDGSKVSKDYKLARTMHYGDKLDLLRRRSIIDQDTECVLRRGHQIRNRTYHRGDGFQDIIWDAALYFFDVVCQLFLACSDCRHQDGDTSEHRSGAESRVLHAATSHSVSALLERLPRPSRPLGAVLAEDLGRQVDGLDSLLRECAYYLNSEPQQQDPPLVLLVQVHWFSHFDPLAPRQREYEDAAKFRQDWATYEAKKLKGKVPRFGGEPILFDDPVPPWTELAQQLASEPADKAFCLYVQTVEQLIPLLEAADEMARGLDHLADLAVDAAKTD